MATPDVDTIKTMLVVLEHTLTTLVAIALRDDITIAAGHAVP